MAQQQQFVKVSSSFKDREMLSDSELSEDYDEDAYFQDFEDQARLPQELKMH
jgi:hypothetical protein